MIKNKVTFSILLLLIASDMLETTLHLFFKKSALSQSGTSVIDLASAIIFFKGAFLSPYLWAGLATVVMVFIIWSSVLSKIDLSVAVPVASFSYIFVPIASAIFLNEKITLLRWLGILFIIAGVILVSLSSKERELANK